MSSQGETEPPSRYQYFTALRHTADRETKLWWRKRKGKGTITVNDESVADLDNDGKCDIAKGSIVWICEMEVAWS